MSAQCTLNAMITCEYVKGTHDLATHLLIRKKFPLQAGIPHLQYIDIFH